MGSDIEKPRDGWGAEPFFFTEAARGGPWLWRVGDPGLAGEPLGPVRHAHDGAAEYYYMFKGDGIIEVSGKEAILREGELAYIPPDAPHNFLGPASQTDAWFFCVVAPNYAERKWRIRSFLPGSEDLSVEVATPFKDRRLPAGGNLSVVAETLEPGAAAVESMPIDKECVYLVVAGSADVALESGLAGAIHAGSFLHVREGMAHTVGSSVGAKIIRFDCAFKAWEGIETDELADKPSGNDPGVRG